ncbi:NAD(P)-binding protein [Dothidotthia symphoricarpi CBS 119687]|uniref:Short-chain dehydrogenase/reductase 3 n=1 Tax=Dothidotthia symphoricarpi CBS 119687 TaxID=1392245 RepID=A0A6A6AJM5_9PLEO|nr:NAD(P)-binding protein [Dothidotthia symphoricarpi CBS 119687]KAF2130631.1 NAD(P)-binding protein [Dothidotthia symphoricarpi CBS 119687]
MNLSDDRYATLVWFMKCVLGLGAVNEVNTLLNSWAANRWVWKSDKSNWNWKSEVAVVTGGSKGIGACVVKKLVSHGVKVAVLDVEPLSNDFSQDELPSIHHYQCDITSQPAIHHAAEAIRSALGPPSILINNAGIGNAYTILDIPPSNLRKLFDINLLSQWTTVQEFLPDMLAKKKGHIMSVASLASFVALAGAVDYSCTKAALLAFHEGLTQELKHRYKCPQIKTTIVHPNWTRSAITAHPAMEAGLKSVGVGLLEPQDVADAMVKQILAAKSGQIVLGPGLAPKIRALPLWIQELIRDSQAGIVSGGGTTASVTTASG